MFVLYAESRGLSIRTLPLRAKGTMRTSASKREEIIDDVEGLDVLHQHLRVSIPCWVF